LFLIYNKKHFIVDTDIDLFSDHKNEISDCTV